ncbi:MAG: HAD-IB family phosphatase [Nitrospira sp.]|nr:HAD-IB family phosphatase [Nitrospira sp.]
MIFDLDHILARRDTYLSYLWGYLCRYPGRITRCAVLPYVVLSFVLGRMTNAALKERFLQAVPRDVSRIQIESWTNEFIERVGFSALSRHGLATLAGHRRRGDYLVLLSASPDCYVQKLGSRLGFDEVICPTIEWQQDRISGRLAGPNMQGKEKAQVVLAVRERFRNSQVVAYADHVSDFPILRLADRGVLVNGKAKSRRWALRMGIEVARWR